MNMKKENKEKLEELLKAANDTIQGVDPGAQGGVIRATKGKLLEDLCKELVKIAWGELDGNPADLSFSGKKIDIPIKREYIQKVKTRKEEVGDWIENNIDDFIFKAQVDVHVMIKGDFVLGIECKAYTENAMLKRILVDFSLLKSKYPHLKCALLQLESQLTGDYCEIDKSIIYGSHSSHTLMSLFDVDLHIMTLLKGERKVDEPIHKKEFFKPLLLENAEKVIRQIMELLREYK